MAESYEAMMQRLNNRVMELAEPLIIQAAQAQLDQASAPGGALYSMIEEQMIDSAAAVYAGYTPVKYARRGTLMDPGQYQIAFKFNITKDSWSGTCSVQNQATGEEDGLLEPLIMGGWSRPPYYWPDGPKEPWSIGGRDLYSEVVGGSFSINITIDWATCVAQAVEEIVVPWAQGVGQ